MIITVANQDKFMGMVAKLVNKAHELGFMITGGTLWREPWVALYYEKHGKGVYPSYHTHRLAVDVQLHKDGKYLRDTKDYEPLGAWWETIGGTWGGRFTKPDGNHFSYLE